jgi:hypothetical protein
MVENENVGSLKLVFILWGVGFKNWNEFHLLQPDKNYLRNMKICLIACLYYGAKVI